MLNSSKLALLKKTLIFPHKHLENGQTQESLNLLKSKTQGQDYLITNASSTLSVQTNSLVPLREKEKEEFVMQESLPIIKKKISLDKQNTLVNDTLITKSSQILPQVLTGKEKVCKPFWTESSKNLSKNLWLPTKIDYQDSDLTLFNGSAINLIANSWFSTNIQTKTQNSTSHKMYYPLLTSSQQKIMECDLLCTEKKEILRSKKIKIYPTTSQKKLLNIWFGSCRWVYNQCVNYINATKKNKAISEKILRDKFINGDKKAAFSQNVPFDVRDEAMRDAIKNMKANYAKQKKSNKKYYFQLKFKKKKNNVQSITIRQKHFNRKTGMYSWISQLKMSEKIKTMETDFRILKDLVGDYFICLVNKKNSQSESQACKFSKTSMNGVISLDPGVRTFLTGYDPVRKNILNLGTNVQTISEKHQKTIDILSKKIQTTKDSKKKSRYNKALRKIRRKVKNQVKDMHHKISKFLCTNYKTIIIPEFRVKDMVSTENRKLQKKTVRGMLSMSHFMFKQILLAKSEQYKYCKVVLVTEEYTSQTCGNCGTLHKTLGGSKNFNCSECKYPTTDRDVNGARNIMIKTIQ